MKGDRASSTALLIARGLLLAEATPSLQPLVAGNSAALTRQILNERNGSRLFEFAIRRGWMREIMFTAERALSPGILLHWLVRKQLIESHARDAIAAGCRQIVVLGAGFDTLALRLGGLGKCFELDHPATQAIKRRAVADEIEFMPADFLQTLPSDILRTQSRFAADRPALFIAEGLFMYLRPERVAELFRDLAMIGAPGSRFIFTFMEARPDRPIGFETSRSAIDWWLRWRGEPFRWALARENADAFTGPHGWQISALSAIADLRRRFLTPHRLGFAPLAAGESIALAHRLVP